MSDVYATRSDLYRFGLTRGTLGNPARLVASALASSNVFELDGHGFEDGDVLLFRATEGGSLPAPIVEGASYYAIRLSESTFSVSLTNGGSAIDLTTDGVSVLVAIELPFDDILEFYSRFVDPFIPAHAVPLTAPYPITVTAIVAELSAKKLQLIAGQSSASMDQTELAAKAQLERWAKAIPLRDARATAPTNLAVSQSARDPRGWGSDCLP